MKNRPLRAIVCLICFTAAVCLTIHGQNPADPQSLIPGQTVEREMTGAETHRYKFELKKDEFFQVRVEQKGVDVALKLFEVKGKILKAMDSPDSVQNFKEFMFISSKGNVYVLEISNIKKASKKSSYIVKRENTREATESEKISFSDFLAREADKLLSIRDNFIGKASKSDKRETETSQSKEVLFSVIELYKDVISLTEDTPKDIYRIYYFYSIGHNYYIIKDFPNSLDYLNKARSLNNSDRYRAVEWQHRILATIGLVFEETDNQMSAIEYYKKAIFDWQANWKDREKEFLASIIARLDYLLGTSSDYGTYKEINRTYAQLIEIAKKYSFAEVEQFLRIHQGKSYYDMGQYKEAIGSYDEASKIDGKDLFAQGSIARGMGTIYLRTGKLEKAEEYYKKSMSFAKILKDNENVIIDELNIGCVSARTNNLSKNRLAIRTFKRLFPVMEKWPYLPKNDYIHRQQYTRYVLETSFYYALAYRKTGDYNNAILILEKSMDGSKEFKLTKYESRAAVEIGVNYLLLNKAELALEKFKIAYQLSKQANVRDEEIASFDGMMRGWELVGDIKSAIFFGKQAVNLLQKTRLELEKVEKGGAHDFVKDNENTYRKLADILIQRGQFAQAEQVLAMLKEEEYFDFVRRDASEISKLGARTPLSETEKALIARYSLLADKVTEIGQEFTKLDDKKRQLTRTDQTLSAEEQKRYTDLENQLADANAAFQLFLTKELIAEIGKEKAAEIEIDHNLQNNLREWGKGTVALYTVAGRDRYRAVLTTSKIQVDGKTEIKIAELNEKVFAFRAALQNPNVDPRPLGKDLYDILIKPIEKELKAANAKTLIWSLDGTLRYIPLAALSPDGKRYLIEDYQNVILTPKTRDDLVDSDPNWQALGLGVSEGGSVVSPEDPTRKTSFPPLPGTERELVSIVKDEKSQNETGVLPGRRFINKDFTAANLKEALIKETEDGKRKYNLVHIASHFHLGSNYSNSFLLLGNGQILTLAEILSSPTIDFGNIDLITLSACNTGFADDTNGKEIDSLASIIQTKSGKAVLATLWSVADESTALLMSEFYRLRKENPKLTKAEAIQLAQQAMIEGKLRPSNSKPIGSGTAKGIETILPQAPASGPSFQSDPTRPYAHPYYWSPFVLIGNWR
jgi:CHAT domain-containing protein/tetratricopeptide (TPR) repeat protein